MTKLNLKHYYTTPYIVLFLSFSTLLYFCFTTVARGDEGTVYLGAFKQAYFKFPLLDVNPYWPISSFYLWIVAALAHILPEIPQLTYIIPGRLFSLFCWGVLFVISKKINNNQFPWAATFILFNPYLLTYATRAHPLVPGLLIFLFFWIGIQKNKKAAFVLLPLAVNFQVYIGGTIGLFFPKLPLKKKDVVRFIVLVSLAISGVIITWLTWDGLFPGNFYKSDFYKYEHAPGSPSFGYPITVLLLAGLPLWFAGQRTFTEIKSNKVESRFILLTVLMGCLILAVLPDKLLGIVNIGSKQLVGSWSKFTWIFIYGVIGLGWLRVHRDHYHLLFSLLGSGILLITLPYFYERISFFATFAPCLAWSTRQSSYIASSSRFTSLILIIFLFFSILYQLLGNL